MAGDNEEIDLGRLNKKKEHKLTRRRVMKVAAASGFSTVVAANMTAEDVKAADSDQVTVSFDIDGNSKHTVAKDRLEWLKRAKKANKQVRKGHWGKSGIRSIGQSGGDGEDNPHVVVTLDKSSSKKEERRGELPEEANGIRVEVREVEEDSEVHCTTDCWEEGHDKFPGGMDIWPGGCTNSSRVIEDNYNWFGWSTALHCGNCNTNESYGHSPDNDDDCWYELTSSGGLYDKYRDIAYFPSDKIDKGQYNRKPSDHTEGVKILGTVTEEGFGIVDEEYGSTHAIIVYGTGSCFNNFKLSRWNETISNDEYDCHDTLYDHMVVGHDFLETTNQGDSGALFFVEDPNNGGDYYAMGSVTGKTNFWESHGPQGFTLHNLYGRAWR